MNLSLHQLRIFLSVCATRSMSKTAQEMHLTQPAISIQLKNLQEQCGAPLLEVVGRQVYVTALGQQIAGHAATMLQHADAIEEQVLQQAGELTGRISIAVVSTGKYVMPYFLTNFVQQHPRVNIAMDVTNKGLVVDALHQNAPDFALVSVLPEKLALDKLDLMPNHLVLVGRKERTRKPLQRKQLAQLPWIFREQGSATRMVMERFLRKQAPSVIPAMELTSNEAVKQAVMAGLGHSIMPLIGLKNELKSGDLQVLPYPGLPLQTMWRLVWMKGKKLSPAVTALLENIRKHKAEIIAKHFKT